MTSKSLAVVALAAVAVTPVRSQETAKPAAVPELAPYSITIAGTKIDIPMVPIPVGAPGYPATFAMGSPEAEADRNPDEGPQHTVRVAPFWIGKFEITWDTYNEFRKEYATRGGDSLKHANATPSDWADAVSLPTPLYEQDSAPILAGMGTADGYPVANISQFAARQFTKWLSKRTGQFYRLPTEAEWEYAARGGTTTAYSFGDDPAQLGDYAVYFDNSAYEDPAKGHPDFGAGYRKIGSKKPNPFGLFDMHGNVAEWVLDAYVADSYAKFADGAHDAADVVQWPEKVFPCVARGGSWDAEPAGCRSAARLASKPAWQERDPQFPKSVWWFTDGFHVGFRILRPAVEPSVADQLRAWESADESTLSIITTSGKEVRARVEAAGGGDGK